MFGIKRDATDALFSDLVREKADWTCERCHREFVKKETSGASGLECSHFWGRGCKSTRFDFENASALCTGCHMYFTARPAEHAEFFLKRLGPKKYDALGVRARTPAAQMDIKSLRLAMRMELKEMKERPRNVLI